MARTTLAKSNAHGWLKMADGAERPPSLVAVYQKTVAKLEQELSA